MKINNKINELKVKCKKDKILITILSIFLVTSILLFIFLSNYKIKTLMSVIGSITNSILAIALIFVVLGLYLPNTNLLKFYQDIDLTSCSTLKVEECYFIGKYTVKKNVTLDQYLINKKEYYVLDPLDKNKQIKEVLVTSNYVVKVNYEK